MKKLYFALVILSLLVGLFSLPRATLAQQVSPGCEAVNYPINPDSSPWNGSEFYPLLFYAGEEIIITASPPLDSGSPVTPKNLIYARKTRYRFER